MKSLTIFNKEPGGSRVLCWKLQNFETFYFLNFSSNLKYVNLMITPTVSMVVSNHCCRGLSVLMK